MRALVLVALLAGCGGSADNTSNVANVAPAVRYPCGDRRNPAASDPFANNHECGWEFDAQGPRGLKLNYRGVLPAYGGPVFPLIDPATYEAEFDEVLACTHLSAPMPQFVVLTDDSRTGFFEVPPLITMYYNERSVFKHETIHWVLYYTTGSADPKHTSGLFMQCDGRLRNV